MRSVYMYEDDYCMCEVLPEACFYSCAEQIKKIKQFSAEATEENFYVIPPPAQSIKDLKISKEKMCASLGETTKGYDIIESPIVDDKSLEDGCEVFAYGNSDRVNLFFSADKKTNYVQRIWLVITPYSDDDKEEAEKIFTEIEKVGEFLYVDYFTDSLFLLNDKNGKKKYIDDLTSWFLKQQRNADKQSFSLQ